ncbi:oxidoreductase [Amylibacter sp. IMCC11727]|uniref:oxidoreductase n=1 Tax=Amylibacter sp. IMCC11727 TaxID=3039851 RepID=UPI00244DC897|nr:oxidoreductase [Amylibacter sp. IMCC11727]WGI21352.1 oxidoreductase [Amylibacter sp. IMCC11727]
MALSDQLPLHSGFHAKSTALEVVDGIDLTGKTAIVTGGYSGLGLETTRALAAKGAAVIVPVRNPAKASETLADVTGNVTTAPLDLGDLASVRAFADAIRADHTQIDILINNAGIMACLETRVGPNWESQFGVNHMGHFALTTALMPVLQNTDARVVALSSTGHKLSDIRWDDIHYHSTDYDKWQAYGQAKTANALFANALSRRLKPTGGHAFSVHPGGIFTPLQRHLPKEEMIALGWLGEDGEPSELAKQGFKTPEQGASTSTWAATSAKLNGIAGVYCEDCDIAAVTDPDSPTARFMGVNPHACDDDSAERLWQISETLLESA